MDGALGRFYDAIENPRASRNELPILRGEELRTYMREVRERALDVLDTVDVDEGADDPRLRDGFVYEMLIAHEHQHNETMLQLLQMVDGYELPPGIPRPEPVEPGPAMVDVAGGTREIGAGDRGFAYDNERPRHEVELAPFQIDRAPVTNGDFAAFVDETGAGPPLYWERDGECWVSTTFGRRDPVDPDLPVIHVDHEQASTFAAGRASACRPSSSGRPPPRPTAGPCRCSATSGSGPPRSSAGYPGFEAFPYPEYSEVFFGSGYRVLRGGSWATRRNVIRRSFRNWDLPERRQIFSGFRCVVDL